MKKIITIQHTQSEQHLNGMIGSLQDWDLTELGVRQAHNIGSKLCREIDCEEYSLYSSDLLRARHTSEILSDYLNIKPIYSSFLREFDLGEAVGKTKSWAKENVRCPVWANTVDWATTKNDRVFDKAESRADVWERAVMFYEQYVNTSDKNVIIVSHDGFLSIFYAMWLGLDLDILDRCNISGKSGGVSILTEDSEGHRILSRLNDMTYIQNSSAGQ